MLEEDLAAGDQPILVERPDRPRDDVELNPAARTAPGDAVLDQDGSVLSGDGLQRLEPLPLKRVWLHPAAQVLGAPVGRLSARRDELDVRMHEGDGRVEVFGVHRRKPAADAFFVLL